MSHKKQGVRWVAMIFEDFRGGAGAWLLYLEESEFFSCCILIYL